MRKALFILSALLFITFGSYSQVFKIVLNQPDPLDIDPGRDTLICKNHSVILGGKPTAIGGTEEYIYLWSPIDGLDNPTLPNPTASPSENTKYLLTVTDINGCQLMDFVNISIDACLGVDEDFIDRNLTVYPNPGSGIFTVSGLPVGEGDVLISVLNGLGKEVLNHWLNAGSDSQDFDLAGEGLPKGIYFFRIVTHKEVLIRRIQMI